MRVTAGYISLLCHVKTTRVAVNQTSVDLPIIFGCNMFQGACQVRRRRGRGCSLPVCRTEDSFTIFSFHRVVNEIVLDCFRVKEEFEGQLAVSFRPLRIARIALYFILLIGWVRGEFGVSSVSADRLENSFGLHWPHCMVSRIFI
jgi:hypothetical protein